MPFTTLNIDINGPVAELTLNRPDKANALNMPMWEELPKALNEINDNEQVRVMIIRGAGNHFTAGIDISVLGQLGGMVSGKQCATRGREQLLTFIEMAQSAFTAFERLRVPAIAAIHGACVGGGVDLIGACDIRVACRTTRFCIKEVDLAVVPDVGTLQRLRHIIGMSALTELTYTAETFDGERALNLGLVSRCCDTPEATLAAARELANTIAAKSPTAVRGIKRNLLWARDHDVADGLAYTAVWNAAMLVGDDAREAVTAQMQKRPPKFAD